MAEKIFGTTIVNSAGRAVPVRHIGEQHVQEDLGRVPTLADWLSCIAPASWMLGVGKNLEKELALASEEDAAKTTTEELKRAPTRGVTTI
jgi:hypothetical protein